MSWSAPEDWSRWDPETLLQCPYDQGHLIRAKRYQHHLLKCRKNYPDRDFVNCPFNAKHVMLRSEVRHHVSRCPDRSAIEQYSYKGSEKDDEGFYFKGNTSVPSYHRTEDLQRGLESWDGANEEEQAQRNHEHESVHNQHSESELRDTSSLSPEEQKRFKRNLKREAALRGMNNSLEAAPTWKSTLSNRDNHGQANSANSNHPIFNHCTQQLQTTSRTSFHEPHNLTINAEKTEHSGAESKNRIFRYCMEKMQQNPYCDEVSSSVSLASNREHESSPVSVSENSVLWYEDSVASSVDTNSPPRHSSVEIRRETWCTDNPGNRSELAAVSNVCGSPTSSTCVGNKTSPQLAGVGRARLHAEARKSNFGGISYSHPGASGADARKTPPVGRGRGMLNYMFLSDT